MSRSSNSVSRKPQSDRSLTETDLAHDKMGNNQLQSDDQSSLRNKRQGVPDVKTEPDGRVTETFENTDKDRRARRNPGKGKGVHPRHAGRDLSDDITD